MLLMLLCFYNSWLILTMKQTLNIDWEDWLSQSAIDQLRSRGSSHLENSYICRLHCVYHLQIFTETLWPVLRYCWLQREQSHHHDSWRWHLDRRCHSESRKKIVQSKKEVNLKSFQSQQVHNVQEKTPRCSGLMVDFYGHVCLCKVSLKKKGKKKIEMK